MVFDMRICFNIQLTFELGHLDFSLLQLASEYFTFESLT
jgi:hypothetical protein